MDYDLPGANGMRRLRRLENILHAFEARLLLHRGKRNEIRRVQRDVYPVLLRKPWKQRRGLFRKADQRHKAQRRKDRQHQPVIDQVAAHQTGSGQPRGQCGHAPRCGKTPGQQRPEQERRQQQRGGQAIPHRPPQVLRQRGQTAALPLYAQETALLLTLIGAIGTHGIMNALSTPENIFADGSLYLRVYVFGLLFLFIYNVCTGIFNAMGDSRTPLILLVLSSVGNVILDMVFVAGLHWGVAGVAWATFIAQGASGVLAFVLLLRRVRFGPLELGDLRRGEWRELSAEEIARLKAL